MFQLKINQQQCNGKKSCGDCEKVLPGFISEYKGDILISDTVARRVNEVVCFAVEACPSQALSLNLFVIL